MELGVVKCLERHLQCTGKDPRMSLTKHKLELIFETMGAILE